VGLEDCSFPVNAKDTKDGIPSEDRSLDEALAFQIQLGLGLMLPPKERATPLNMTCWIPKSRICKEE
jgi:hypothetical protein